MALSLQFMYPPLKTRASHTYLLQQIDVAKHLAFKDPDDFKLKGRLFRRWFVLMRR